MSKCWYCNNELTTGDNPKHFGICNKCYNEMFKSSDTIVRSLTNKITELQKQLEEKEKEIAYLTKQVKKFNNEAQKYFEDAYCNDFHNQDKIDFAVEQLKKVKEMLQPYLRFDINLYLQTIKNIDNQIKQLKEKNN